MTVPSGSFRSSAEQAGTRRLCSMALTPILSPRFGFGPSHVVVCLLWMVVYLILSYLPLATSGGVWRHVAAGEHICAHRTLPSATDALPLAAGRPATDTSWLSDVLLYGADLIGGPAGLSTLYACVVLQTLSILGAVFYLQTGRKRFSIVGVALVTALGFHGITVLRPATFGLLCLSGLLLVFVINERRSRALAERERCRGADVLSCSIWLAPILLALWTNLDSSFVVGAAVLAAWAGCSAIDVVARQGIATVLEDADCRRRLLVLEVSLAATLLNPLGLDAWLAALGLRPDVLGAATALGSPLVLGSLAGVPFAMACLAAGYLLKKSPKPFTASEILLFTGGALAAAWNSYYLIWFGLLAAYVMVPHIAKTFGVAPRVHVPEVAEAARECHLPPQPLQFSYTLICVMVVGVAGLLSPAANRTLGARPRPRDHMVARQTPLGVADWLDAQNLCPKLMWAMPDWCDYLSLRTDTPVMVNSALAMLPDQVRSDSARLEQGERWQTIADRYAVDLIVIDKERQRRMTQLARRAGWPWHIAYEDKQSLVLTRADQPSPRLATIGQEEST